MRSEGRARAALQCFCHTPQRLSRGRRLTAPIEGCSGSSGCSGSGVPIRLKVVSIEYVRMEYQLSFQRGPGFPRFPRRVQDYCCCDRTGIAAAAQSRGRRLTASGCSGSGGSNPFEAKSRLNTFEWSTSSRSTGSRFPQISPAHAGLLLL